MSEERSDELRRRFYGILKYNADTYGLNVSAANSNSVSNVVNTSSLATRFARRSFEEKLQILRNAELGKLQHYVVFQAVSGTLWSTVPLLVAVATFTVYVLSGNRLDVSTALTSLALFEILRFPLFMLPNVINNIVEASVSLGRIESFLKCKNQEDNIRTAKVAGGDSLAIAGATFVWEGKR